MRRVPLVVLLAVLLALACGAVGCSSEEEDADTTQASLSSTTAATETEPQTTTTTTATEAMASTTTTAFSRPVTTDLPTGGVVLDSGNVQVEGYIVDVHDPYVASYAFILNFVPSAQFADEAHAAAALEEIVATDASDPRMVLLSASETVSITVSTLGDGGEQALTPEDYLSLWSASPPEDGEHLSDRSTLWSIEYDEDSLVVSITEVSP